MSELHRTIQLDDINLSYTEWPGKKGPVICLPSLAGHKGTFTNIAGSLAPEYHLFALDLRGRGDSDKPSKSYGFAYHTRDILQFAHKLDFDSFAIIGHSFGATVGVYVASTRPDSVQAIVLMDGGGDPCQETLEAMRPMIDHLDRVYPTMEDYLEKMQALPFYHPWSTALEQYLRDDVELLPNGAVCPKASAEALEQDLEIHFHRTMCLHLPQMRCPALFIRPGQGLLGDRGYVFTEREVETIVKSIPGCQRVDLPNVNHYTMVLHDNPPVIPPIRAFLQEVIKCQEFAI